MELSPALSAELATGIYVVGTEFELKFFYRTLFSTAIHIKKCGIALRAYNP